jgi:hypothetical protein
MPLSPSALSSSLKSAWLPTDGGSRYPGSANESGDAFAGAVSSWFAQAMASGFPCATATARRGQLAAGAAAAFSAQDASAAGALLATALTSYLAGQAFGAGVASPPVAMAAAQAAFTGVFSDLDASVSARADRIAQGTWALALTTIVVFPPVIGPPAPVT